MQLAESSGPTTQRHIFTLLKLQPPPNHPKKAPTMHKNHPDAEGGREKPFQTESPTPQLWFARFGRETSPKQCDRVGYRRPVGLGWGAGSINREIKYGTVANIGFDGAPLHPSSSLSLRHQHASETQVSHSLVTYKTWLFNGQAKAKALKIVISERPLSHGFAIKLERVLVSYIGK